MDKEIAGQLAIGMNMVQSHVCGVQKIHVRFHTVTAKKLAGPE